MDGVFTTLDDLCENWKIYKQKIGDLEVSVKSTPRSNPVEFANIKISPILVG